MIKLHIWLYLGALCLSMWLGTCQGTHPLHPRTETKYPVLLIRLLKDEAFETPSKGNDDEDDVQLPEFWREILRPAASKFKFTANYITAEQQEEQSSFEPPDSSEQRSENCCPPPSVSGTEGELELLEENFETDRQKKNSEKRYPIHLDPFYHYRFLSRSGECPKAKDGQSEFYCPTPNKDGIWKCIDDHQLCDGVRHCPNGEDELPIPCLFYKVVETHLNTLSKTLTGDKRRRRN